MSLRPPFFGSVKLTFQAGLLGSKGKSAVNPPVVRFRREVTMAPPPMDTKTTADAPRGLSAAEVRETLEFARELSKEPYRLSAEHRAEIKAGVLSSMGYER